ncbi:hypothetical protein [Chachezhania antarctica]|nr:hypothetical protein [Chachezhania antarctica]|tara:strand:+ start:508 stop:630 length:123 start_codon:yes stop_codon:yes gene_type:complete
MVETVVLTLLALGVALFLQSRIQNRQTARGVQRPGNRDLR